MPSDILLGDQVGRGTYGQVFAASFLGRPAAVKAVPVELNADGRRSSELQREIKMLKTCDPRGSCATLAACKRRARSGSRWSCATLVADG